MRKVVVLFVLVLSHALVLAEPSSIVPEHPPQALAPRVALPKPARVEPPSGPASLRVKFRDDLKVRRVRGEIVSSRGVELGPVRSILARHRLQLAPLIQLPEPVIASLELRAAARSGKAQPDLAGIFAVHTVTGDLQAAAEELLGLAEVEWVEYAPLVPPPPCADLPPPTPSYFSQGRQGYHGANPGVNALYAWSLGARGQGIRIADCEYGYIAETEDLCGIVDEPGQTIHPSVEELGWDDHGTSVLGEMVALDNAYGITGIAPAATPLFFPEWTVEEGHRRVTAITHAVASVDPGDVVLIEMQSTLGYGFGPAELELAVWTVTRAAVDAGVVVVAAAGNGDQDLDAPEYAGYRARGDSGAMLVGAGSRDVLHGRLSFSTYGRRINLQGWGSGVFSTGNGDFAELDDDPRQRYTATFSGTSAAVPIVAASVAVLQSLAAERHGCRLDPLVVRQVLADTGIVQGAGAEGHIGPLPDLRAAADLVATLSDCSYDAVCGNGVREGPEGCDAEDLGACKTTCLADCTCDVALCGNGIREGAEPCDVLDMGSCTAECLPSCTCSVPTPGEVRDVQVAKLAPTSPKVVLSFTPACAASNVTVVYGPLSGVGRYEYTGQVCGLANSGHADGVLLDLDSCFFLLVASNGAGGEGPYGPSTSAGERPDDVHDPVCPLTRTLVERCDR